MSKFIFMTAGIVMNSANIKCASVEDCNEIDGFSNPNAEIMEEIKKDEEARIREQKKNAAKNQLQEDRYRQDSEKLELRRKRTQEDALAKKLKARTAENEKFASGGVSIEDHKKNLDEINEEYDKNIRKAENEYSNAMRKLRQMNPEGFNRSYY